jgi:hypothetical protein
VFGTAGLVLTTTTFTGVPGLTTTVKVPVTANGSVVYIETDGGVGVPNACGNSACLVIVDVEIVVDGAPLPHGGYQRIVTQANDAVFAAPTAYWSMAQAVSLAAGTHSITVEASLVGTFAEPGALVSGGDASVLQGELTALVVNK